MTRLLGAVVLASLALCLLPGCPSYYLARAPRSSAVPWELPVERSPRAVPNRLEAQAAIQPDHRYTLSELIDIAESANPDTRIGWQKARQAALAVGAANAGYFPVISALTMLGYERIFFPAPDLKQSTLSLNSMEFLPGVSMPTPPPPAPSGFVGVDTFQVLPFLSVRWSLLDVGRAAEVKAAEQRSVAANALFTAEHQKIMLEVARAYFRLSAARAQTTDTRDALERTRSIAKAAEARFAQGIATAVELSEAKREVAQAEYNLTQAEALENTIYTSLVSAMGIDPLVHLDVAANPSRELPNRLGKKVEDYVQSALRMRPDLRAALAQVPSTRAEVSRGNAAYWPRVNLVGTAGTALLGTHIDGFGLKTINIPNIIGFVNIDWRLFDGGLRELQIEAARSRHSEAEQELVKLEHQTVREVIAAYNEVNASFSRHRAALALLNTATVAEDAVTKSYLNGLATLTDAMNAQKARALASAAKEQAFADALVAAATLAFSAGELTSASAVVGTAP